MGHVAVMASASSVGLMTLFVVDLVDMFFLSPLGETELAAAVGFSGTILFFTTSIAIGIAISMGALVARSLGQGKREAARAFAINVLVYGTVVAFIISAILWFWVPDLLGYLGAEGRALELSVQYLRIIVPSMFMMTMAMASSGILRATGDPRRAMMATVWFENVANQAVPPSLAFVIS